MPFSPDARRGLRILMPVLLALFAPGLALQAQQHPAEVTPDEAPALPYRLSGRMNVEHGMQRYFGTATFIRRYTGVTAGHLLYDPKTGLSTNLYYEPALYLQANSSITVSFFAVLSGYQSAAQVDPDSNAAFDQDMGYVLFSRNAPGNEFAAFGADTDLLTTADSFLALGYAAESFPGDELAFVNVAVPYYELQAPGLYENTSYYTEEGMSGGPLYVTRDGAMEVAAVNVAGTSEPDPAYSDVRAITSAETRLFTEAEYAGGLITAGTIKGPTSVASGGSGKYKVGVVFKDGLAQGTAALPGRYDELVLTPTGAHRKDVSVTRLVAGKFKVKFYGTLVHGDTITLKLLRTTAAKSDQTALQTMTVTVQ